MKKSKKKTKKAEFLLHGTTDTPCSLAIVCFVSSNCCNNMSFCIHKCTMRHIFRYPEPMLPLYYWHDPLLKHCEEVLSRIQKVSASHEDSMLDSCTGRKLRARKCCQRPAGRSQWQHSELLNCKAKVNEIEQIAQVTPSCHVNSKDLITFCSLQRELTLLA